MVSSPPSGRSPLEEVRAHAVSNRITESVIGRWQRLVPSNDRNDRNSQRHQLGAIPDPITHHRQSERIFFPRAIPHPITHRRSLVILKENCTLNTKLDNLLWGNPQSHHTPKVIGLPPFCFTSGCYDWLFNEFVLLASFTILFYS